MSRRAVLGLAWGLGALSAAVLQSVEAAAAAAADHPPHLDPKDPAAIQLAYVEDATRIDAKSQPKFIAGSNCENCLLLQGKPGDPYRPCSLFPGKLVNIGGWCSGWAAEM
jgi:hypothetical protein